MQRLMLASVLSFAAGIGAGYGFLGGSGDRPGDAPTVATTPLRSPSADDGFVDPLAPGAPAVAERARVYQTVAAAGADELHAIALAALAAADEPGSSFELDVVLARLIEIDPDEALAFAREQNLGPARTLDIALGLLDASGYSEQALDDILARLPDLDRNELRARALERLASTDPDEALALALAAFGRDGITPVFGFFDSSGPQTLRRIATVWAGRDPDAALAAIDTIADPQARSMFAQAVLTRVAQSDADTVLAYLDVMNVPEPQRAGLMQSAIAQLAARDPERALRYAESLGGQSGQMAMMMTVQQWARRDAAAALAYVEAMPAGMLRQNPLQQIATAYGRSEPAAALAWAESLTTGRTQAYAAILAGIAQVDPLRALDLAFDESRLGLSSGAQTQVLMSVVLGAAVAGSVSHRALADRVLALDPGQARQNALQMLGQRWAASDLGGALDWFLSNQESVGANALADLARQVGRQDPQTAALYTARLLPELRQDWIRAVASGYAQTDPNGARSWAQQFRGEPVYEAAVTEIIRFSAGADPAGAAALWASVDFADPVREAQIASNIAGSWAAQDWPAARNWVATLPQGEIRDGALTGLMSVGQEIPDASVMSLFSDDERRFQAVSNVIMRTAQFDAERAREMIAQYLDEPWRRERAEQMIENMQRRTPAIYNVPPGAVPAIGFRSSVPVIER